MTEMRGNISKKPDLFATYAKHGIQMRLEEADFV